MRYYIGKSIIIVKICIIAALALTIYTHLKLKLDKGPYKRPLSYNKHQSFESSDVWRSFQSNKVHAWSSGLNRFQIQPDYTYKNDQEYLQQLLAADYAEGSEKIFLMVKTGASELWKKLPVHLFTTLTRIPYFQIYSDAPGSIAGYEIIDSLQNVSTKTLNSEDFEMYRAQQVLHEENGQYTSNDILFNQGWDLDKFKNIPILNHALSIAPKECEWFLMIDADTYIMFDNLINWLAKYNGKNNYHLFGSAAYVDSESFAHGGSGIVISRAAVEDSIGKDPNLVYKYKNQTFDECCGDLMVARMLRDTLNITVFTGFDDDYFSVFQGNPIWEIDFFNKKWCQPILSFHHLTSHDVELLWEYEKMRRRYNKEHIYYIDIYHDFVAPYITSAGRKNWDNKADDLFYSYKSDNRQNWKPKSEGGPVVRPYENAKACKKACEDWETCKSWRYLPNSKYCGMSSWSFKLGRTAKPWINTKDEKYDTTNAISGWDLKKIRKGRDSCGCDKVLELEGWVLDFKEH